MNTLQIISPIAGKGLGRIYVANNYELNPDGTIKTGHAPKEENMIDLGLIIRDENGTYLDGVVVEVEATDESQNKRIAGTGNQTKIYPEGTPVTVPYYPFHYEFKSAGKHTITFKVGDKTESVDLDVTE